MIAPIRPNVEKVMREIGHTIGKNCPAGMGFVLLMFNFGQGGYMNYISNANRQDMINALKEVIKTLEGN